MEEKDKKGLCTPHNLLFFNPAGLSAVSVFCCFCGVLFWFSFFFFLFLSFFSFFFFVNQTTRTRHNYYSGGSV